MSDPRAELELLARRLTRADAGGSHRREGRLRQRAAALALALLAERGLTAVPALPLTEASSVRRAPRLPGSRLLVWALERRDLRVVPDDSPRPRGGSLKERVARTERELGLDWPAEAETMVGLRRLRNVADCVRAVVEDHVPGDLIEAGVWRGGASILMRAALDAHGDTERNVWLADSFAGLPPPSAEFPADRGLDYTSHPELAVALDEVRRNVERYGMLDDRIRFLEGWFADSLPEAPIERLALARLDGDLYESTMDALTALYPKLSAGGFLIVDDYGALKACREAVEDYRAANGITEPIEPIDWTGVYWRRER